MVDGKMKGKDLYKTRAPQGVGITTPEQFIELAKLRGGSSVPRSPPCAPSVGSRQRVEEKSDVTDCCVLVCGGGNAAQVVTGLFATRYKTVAVSFFADEAAKWKAALGSDDFELTVQGAHVSTIKSKPADITNDP